MLLLGAGLAASGPRGLIYCAGCATTPQPQPEPYLLRYSGPVKCEAGKQYLQVIFDITTEGVFAGLLNVGADPKVLQLAGNERP